MKEHAEQVQSCQSKNMEGIFLPPWFLINFIESLKIAVVLVSPLI